MKNKGLMIAIEIIVALVVGLSVFFMIRSNKNGKNLDNSSKETAQKENVDSKTENVTKKTNFLDDDKSYFFAIDGKKYYAGDKISDIANSGFSLRENEKIKNAPAGKYIIGAGNMVNSDDKICFSVTPYNIKDTDLTVQETVLGGFSLDKNYAKNDEKAMNIEIYGGIKIGSTKDEVEKVFGTTDDTSITETYSVYRYQSSEVYRRFEIQFDSDDLVKSIVWKNLEFKK